MDSFGFYLAVITLLTYLVVRSIYRLFFHPLHKIPGPKLAAVTHLYEFYYDVVRGGRYMFKIEKMHEDYGPIVRINPREIHSIAPDFYDEIYASSTRKRDKDPPSAQFSGLLTSLLATVDHDLHKFRRGILKGFFSKRSILNLSHFVDEKVQKLGRRLEKYHNNQTVVRLDDAFAALTSDVITHYCYGKSWDFLDDENFRNDIRASVRDIQARVHLQRFFPIIYHVLRMLPLWIFQLVSPGISAIFENQKAIFEQSRRSLHGKKYDIGHDDPEGKHSTIYDQMMDPSVPAQERSLQRLQDEGTVLLAAGTETTTRALAMAMFYLTRDHETRTRLRDELKGIMPTSSSTTTWSELEQLPYMTGVVNEALRLGGVTTFRFARIAPTETLYYNEHVIPPGTPMSSSSYLIHHNATIFPEPERFSPERWISADQHGEHLTKYLTSFTHGSRMCLGMHLAYVEIYLTLAYLVRRLDFELVNTTTEDMKVTRDIALPQTERGPPTVYARVVGVQD
ncbi:cytochrome P450 [Aspergillus avenaceus]|uniref:Cytochrome P450 monooxygenase otaC n=1 Tax=Aspergillus avenaceus TaxID=36643 RepID=A0A5N6U3L0_ASPAV|nr:cytochrome P450 [Aspergillus avenaceus]